MRAFYSELHYFYHARSSPLASHAGQALSNTACSQRFKAEIWPRPSRFQVSVNPDFEVETVQLGNSELCELVLIGSSVLREVV